MNKKMEEIMNELDSHSIEQVRLRFKEGFNAAIDLNLPVLFAEWSYEYIYDLQSGLVFWIDGKLKTVDEMYNYWLDNVYQPTLK